MDEWWEGGEDKIKRTVIVPSRLPAIDNSILNGFRKTWNCRRTKFDCRAKVRKEKRYLNREETRCHFCVYCALFEIGVVLSLSAAFLVSERLDASRNNIFVFHAVSWKTYTDKKTVRTATFHFSRVTCNANTTAMAAKGRRRSDTRPYSLRPFRITRSFVTRFID